MRFIVFPHCACAPCVRTDGQVELLRASERSERSEHIVVVSSRFYYIYNTRNVLLSAQMGERASVVLICIITSRYNEVK